jgi:hypothetical protein
VFGNHIGAGATLDDIRVDADAAAAVVPPFQASELRSEFVDSVDAFFGSEACVGRAAVND